ncbi:hypothetical protein RB628_31095 [Streptomyces sp. ADMS]|uniref:hypothetical protein n=1 Tax=Streptomyces sp. ADMS TaxID=3071415 RepID=UPI00296FFC28|nr:hypothetical protein [Streptomyces sp. ADMS]MDW4909669.1 hypothetical protein [Streptomyces sp. ADMS]
MDEGGRPGEVVADDGGREATPAARRQVRHVSCGVRVGGDEKGVEERPSSGVGVDHAHLPGVAVLHLLDSMNMAQTTGHGSPLAALKHGGPGRAGGGSEMAGTRGVVDLMQRTALQASPRVLDSLRSAPSSSPADYD